MRAKKTIAGVACAVILAVSVAYAQRGGVYTRYYGVTEASPETYDGAFHFCRAMFRGIQGGDGGGWLTDFPDADHNLSIRLSELTKTPVSMNPRTGQPNFLAVRLTSPELYRCPFIMMFEVGNSYFDEEEAAALRAYLLKGGFLWVDDFWGTRAWSIWESQIRKVFPAGSYPIVDLPLDHPIFSQFRKVSRIPQIPSIDCWLGSGGDTRQPSAAHSRHQRRPRPRHGPDVAQHRLRRFVRARGRQPSVLPHLLRRRLRVRHQRARLRDEPLRKRRGRTNLRC